jgi:hypothetical protein
LSAKHKRPFAVFAAVAIICAMVLITGVRSKAEAPLVPDAGSNRVSTSGTIAPLPEPQGPITPEADPGITSDFGGGSPEAPDTTPGGLEEPTLPSGDGGSDDGYAPTDPLDGVIPLPPLAIPDPEDALPGDDETDAPGDDGKGKGGKGRGGRGDDGKNDDGKIDDGKVEDGTGGDIAPEEEPANAKELFEEPVDGLTVPEGEIELEVADQP